MEGIQPPSSDWDVLVWNSAFAGSPGGYDALSTGGGIAAGQEVSGFRVTFDWLGTGMPGSQYYEVVNPLDYSRILESGWTTSTVIPAPGALVLALTGLAFLRMQPAYIQNNYIVFIKTKLVLLLICAISADLFKSKILDAII